MYSPNHLRPRRGERPAPSRTSDCAGIAGSITQAMRSQDRRATTEQLPLRGRISAGATACNQFQAQRRGPVLVPGLASRRSLYSSRRVGSKIATTLDGVAPYRSDVECLFRRRIVLATAAVITGGGVSPSSSDSAQEVVAAIAVVPSAIGRDYPWRDHCSARRR